MLREQTVVMDKHAGLGVRLGMLLLADLDHTSTGVLQERLCALLRIGGAQGICPGAISEAARVFSWM